MDDPDNDLTVEALTTTQKICLEKQFKRNKIGWTLAVLDLMLSVFVISRYPQHYWLLHLAKSFVLLPIRLFRFARLRWEFYMLDFCYWVTYLTFILVFIGGLKVFLNIDTTPFINLGIFVRMGFFFSCGSLAWSIILFQNSIAFYSFSKMVEVFVHLSPVLMMYCIRWGAGLGVNITQEAWPNLFSFCEDHEWALANECIYWRKSAYWCHHCAAPFSEFITFTPLILFLGWVLPYYTLVFIIFKDHIRRTGKGTLYHQALNSVPRGAPWLDFGNILRKFPEKWRPEAYFCIHGVFTMLFGTIAWVFWHNFFLNTTFVVGLITCAVYQGAAFSFHDLVFKYGNKMLHKHKEKLIDSAKVRKIE